MAVALLVDDDQQLLESVAAVAEAGDLELIVAADWEEGLALFEVLSPDLVIADYNMPGSRHGLQLLAQVRRLRPSVRVILVSGYLEEADMDRVLALNLVDRALTKGTAVETARSIVDEIKAAAEKAHVPTDWQAYATSFLDTTQVSDDDLDELDGIFGAKLDAQD